MISFYICFLEVCKTHPWRTLITPLWYLRGVDYVRRLSTGATNGAFFSYQVDEVVYSMLIIATEVAASMTTCYW